MIRVKRDKLSIHAYGRMKGFNEKKNNKAKKKVVQNNLLAEGTKFNIHVEE